jgi:hypothetical protein
LCRVNRSPIAKPRRSLAMPLWLSWQQGCNLGQHLRYVVAYRIPHFFEIDYIIAMDQNVAPSRSIAGLVTTIEYLCGVENGVTAKPVRAFLQRTPANKIDRPFEDGFELMLHLNMLE